MTNLYKYIKYIEILLTKTIKRCIIITIPVRLWNKNITLGGQSLMNLVEQKLSALPIGSPIRCILKLQELKKVMHSGKM